MKHHLFGCQACNESIPLSVAVKNRGYCDRCATKPQPAPQAPERIREDAQHYANQNGWRVA